MRVATHLFADAWKEAWNARNLEVLVGFFHEDGVYQDVSFGEAGSGHSELRRLFGAILHKPPLRLEITGITDDPESGFALSWIRTGALVPGTPERKFRGRSEFEFEGTHVLRCVDTWEQEKPGHPGGIRPGGGIREDEEQDIVWIGDVWVPVNKRNKDGV